MKVAPPSADLLIKLALLAAAGVAVYLLSQSAAKAAGQLADKAGQVADAAIKGVTPWEPTNIFNQGVMSAGQAVTGDAGWSLGGSIYDLKERLFG
jgi:hypothetical protein